MEATSTIADKVDMAVDKADPRPALFRALGARVFRFRVTAEDEGVFHGAMGLREAAERLGLVGPAPIEDGAPLHPGTLVAEYCATALQVARAEEVLLSQIGKPSGVATAARKAVIAAAGRARLVAGGWKKIPLPLRETLRAAVVAGGMAVRIWDEPFLYLDKNLVRMLGGLCEAIRAAGIIAGRTVVVQVRGEWGPIAEEVAWAAEEGAGTIMVDTGNPRDLRVARGVLDQRAVLDERHVPRPKLAFGGGVRVETVPEICAAGADIVDMGRAIVDAPLLGFRLDVVG